MKPQYNLYIANPGGSLSVLSTVAASSTGATLHKMALVKSGRPTSPSLSSQPFFGLSAPLWEYGSCANTHHAMALLLVMEFLLEDAGTDVIKLPSQDYSGLRDNLPSLEPLLFPRIPSVQFSRISYFFFPSCDRFLGSRLGYILLRFDFIIL